MHHSQNNKTTDKWWPGAGGRRGMWPQGPRQGILKPVQVTGPKITKTHQEKRRTQKAVGKPWCLQPQALVPTCPPALLLDRVRSPEGHQGQRCSLCEGAEAR